MTCSLVETASGNGSVQLAGGPPGLGTAAVGARIAGDAADWGARAVQLELGAWGRSHDDVNGHRPVEGGKTPFDDAPADMSAAVAHRQAGHVRPFAERPADVVAAGHGDGAAAPLHLAGERLEVLVDAQAHRAPPPC